MMPRLFRKWTERYLFCTPRWYSYGGMFESIFLSVNLARYCGKEPVLFYPRKQFKPELRYRGFLNEELREFIADGKAIRNASLVQTIVSAWLDFDRRCWRLRFVRLLFGVFDRLLGLRPELICPVFIGYHGLEDSITLSRKLGVSTQVKWNELFRKSIPICLTEDQDRRGREVLRDMGVRPEKAFVCLYVRDFGFPSRPGDNRQLPNADITNFGLVISFVESLGFHVIRVGDPAMVPYNGGGTKFMDYVHTEFYSELMDLFFYQYCDFWVGTMGGGRFAPIAYRKPCVVVNGLYPAFSGFCINHDDVYLPRHVYSKRLKRFLSLREQLENIDEFDESGYDINEYIPVENTPEEILNAVKEFYSSKVAVDFDWNPELQKSYLRLKNETAKEAFYNPDLRQWKTITHEQTAELQPHISRRFLESCWESSPYLDSLSRYFGLNGSLQGFTTEAGVATQTFGPGS